MDFRRGHGGAIHNVEPIVSKKIIHIIEVAIPAVDEARVVPLVFEHITEREQPLIVGTLDDRLPWGGRNRQGNGFEATHGTGSGGIQVGEQHTLLGEFIEVRSESFAIAEDAEVFGA